MSYTDYKISYIVLGKREIVPKGVVKYWIFMEADYSRLYGIDTFEELVAHLQEVKKMPEYACDKFIVRREDVENKVYAFDDNELEELSKVAPLVSTVHYNAPEI